MYDCLEDSEWDVVLHTWIDTAYQHELVGRRVEIIEAESVSKYSTKYGISLTQINKRVVVFFPFYH